jgi:hypothetical protein
MYGKKWNIASNVPLISLRKVTGSHIQTLKTSRLRRSDSRRAVSLGRDLHLSSAIPDHVSSKTITCSLWLGRGRAVLHARKLHSLQRRLTVAIQPRMTSSYILSHSPSGSWGGLVRTSQHVQYPQI